MKNLLCIYEICRTRFYSEKSILFTMTLFFPAALYVIAVSVSRAAFALSDRIQFLPGHKRNVGSLRRTQYRTRLIRILIELWRESFVSAAIRRLTAAYGDALLSGSLPSRPANFAKLKGLQTTESRGGKIFCWIVEKGDLANSAR